VARTSVLSAGFVAWLIVGNLLSQSDETKRLPPAIFRHWIHSFEEDDGPIRVYRPASYRLPPSRGRDGFEIRPNGEFILFGPSGSDRSRKVFGRWAVGEGSSIRVSFPDSDLNRVLFISEVTPGLLRIRRLPAAK
jgi:hypothetical protein